ncbi:putative F-box protein At3g10430 [Salvia hispanica]|uniref:putative F-box protein At3g10430 n=1 Tax=Salvia hispanica TaxID=49212 RepID=UPI002009673E|nr:putative F-box protein At3g10430 [Salvia hispanica]
MNSDVVFEILLLLPVQSLLKLLGVSRVWYDIIDSPQFRNLHTLLHKNKRDEEVYLRFNFGLGYSIVSRKLSINLLDNGMSLPSHNFRLPMDLSVVSGAVKGLVCLSSPRMFYIAICNPFLGHFKILPLSPFSSTLSCFYHYNVGLGFDEDYKVVQVVQHRKYGWLHASLYSAKTNSWRKLDIDQDMVIEKPIKSVCKNGSFAHWKGLTRARDKEIILSFDMKNEVFRTFTISQTGDQVLDKYSVQSFKVLAILAKEDCSFVILVLESWVLKVYESSGEGSEVVWNNVNDLQLYSFGMSNVRSSDEIPVWRNDDCVALKGCELREVILYDYRARKLIGRFKLPESSCLDDYIIECEGSFISP